MTRQNSKFQKIISLNLVFFLAIELSSSNAINIESTQHFSACLNADNIHRINEDVECVPVQSYFYNNKLPIKGSKLLIFIHGYGAKGGGPSDYLKFQATFILDPSTISTVLNRPGYYYG